MLKKYFKSFKKKFNIDYFAIRSSAKGEDDIKKSFAGQMDSFLFISNFDSFLKSIKLCWASLFSERALTYRHISNISLAQMEIAVIIQEMIFGEISGVMFTANPTNNSYEQVLINATFGIGEGIVSGDLDTDSYIYNLEKQNVSKNPAEKKHKIVLDKNKGEHTKKIPINKKERLKPSLDNTQVKKIVDLGKKIEDIYNIPQDIEWTIKDNKIFILQTRPITTLKEERKNRIIWDNSNIIESFPGITKPLTFSFARMAWSSVFKQSAKAMGVSNKKIQENKELFDTMLGLIHGRVYYNLIKWYQFVSFFPGFKQNRKYMEDMMGVKKSYQYKKQKNRFLSKEGIKSIPDLIKLVYGLVKNYLILDKEVKKFQRNFQINYKKLERYNFEKMKPWEIMNVFNQAKNQLLKGWKVEGINDYSAMVFYGLVSSLTKKYGLDETGSIHNDLFCGEKDMDSTKPTKQLLFLANEIKKDEELYDLFQKNNEKEILNKIKKERKFKKFNDQIEDYLDEFGYRCMGELKLEEKSLKDDPCFVITILKNYLNLNNLDLDSINKKEKEKRINAEKIINEKLKYNPLKKTLFNWALQNARKNVRYRENMRLCRTKVFGLARELFRSIGDSFAREKIIEDSKDIFYLEIDEIFNYIRGTGTLVNLNNLIKQRKKEYKSFEEEELPERFATYGIVNDYDFSKVIIKKDYDMDKKKILTGVSCCPGIVEKEVKVILSPSDNVSLNGEILVAQKTDPGWVPLYPSVSGLLIERGSVLSHSAIVARELGLPTIVGIKDLIKKIKDGQVVKMDANKGVVYLKNQEK